MSRVMHFEIHAENPERAARFYQAVFGWQISKWPGPVDYWLITTGPEGQPGINGGLMLRQGPPPEANQAVNAYVCTVGVASSDATAGAVTAAGGEIVVPKMPVPGIGWLFYAKDT